MLVPLDGPPSVAGPHRCLADGPAPVTPGPDLFRGTAARRRLVATTHGEVLVRPISPLDTRAVDAFVRGLSAATAFRRFHAPVHRLTARQLAGVVDVDHRTSEALVAVAGRQIVGLAQYLPAAMPTGHGGHAGRDAGRAVEVAVVVADAWHRCGLGGALLGGVLDAARDAGHDVAVALVQADNRPVLELLRRSGRVLRTVPAGRTVDVEVDLHGTHGPAPTPQPPSDTSATGVYAAPDGPVRLRSSTAVAAVHATA